jgi:hypothetical protein
MEDIKKWCSDKENLKIVFMIFMAIILVVILKIRLGGKAEQKDVSPTSAHKTEVTATSQSPAREIKQRKMVRTPVRTGSRAFQGTKAPPFLERDLFSSRKSPSVPTRKGEHVEQVELELTATIIDNQGALAIIGDDVFAIGDMVQGYQVMSIKNNEVVLSKGKRQYVFKFNEE